MDKVILKYLLIFFVLGWICNSLYYSYSSLENPFGVNVVEKDSPNDWIKEKDIYIRDRFVIFEAENATWAKFSDTNSMDPVIDIGANSIEILPNIEKLQKGDIISFRTNRGLIIHRIVEIGVDEEGWYCLTKGDNSFLVDYEKVRFEQIKGVVVGIIY